MVFYIIREPLPCFLTSSVFEFLEFPECGRNQELLHRGPCVSGSSLSVVLYLFMNLFSPMGRMFLVFPTAWVGLVRGHQVLGRPVYETCRRVVNGPRFRTPSLGPPRRVGFEEVPRKEWGILQTRGSSPFETSVLIGVVILHWRKYLLDRDPTGRLGHPFSLFWLP